MYMYMYINTYICAYKDARVRLIRAARIGTMKKQDQEIRRSGDTERERERESERSTGRATGAPRCRRHRHTMKLK